MDYYLVDLENVGSRGIEGADLLDSNSCIVIFYSAAAGKISEFCCDLLTQGKADITWEAVNVRTKNALDFELSVYVGILLRDSGTESIFIISADNGYKAVLEAGNKKKRVRVRQYRSILEAWYMKIHLPQSDLPETMVGIKAVRKQLSQKKNLETIAVRLELDPEAMKNLITEYGDDIRTLYLGMLHAFGRDKGLSAYRQLRINSVGPFAKPGNRTDKPPDTTQENDDH